MQKKYFLKFEADKMFLRNKENLLNKNYNKDEIYLALKNKIKKSHKYNILEIGCAGGDRLIFLKKQFPKCNFYGIDPSKKAVKNKKGNNINLKVGSADKLPYIDDKFDIIIFGFCLYLCDNEDLFKIAHEAYRVTKKKSLIVIMDFIQDKIKYNKYSHLKNILSRKMNYINMFIWHPNIKLISHKKIIDNQNKKFSKKNSEISIVCLSKNN
ncbi:class I SAM-dependent methyltransferase [Candidatus Pelagibacter sp.]|nr:class I SAM-dependent methyltransferase [Candidatus Pelagibacter sp.]